MIGLRCLTCRRAVRQHARAVALERVAVWRVGVLRLLVEVLDERRLEEIDRRHVEHVEPHHRLLATGCRDRAGPSSAVRTKSPATCWPSRRRPRCRRPRRRARSGSPTSTCWCGGGDLARQDELDAGEQRLVMRDWPRSAGFSSTSTRRSASSAVITSPASSISFLTSSNFQIAGDALRLRLLGDDVASTSHSGAMSCLVILS